MQRLPNPVSDLNVFIEVFANIYKILNSKSEFYLDDISYAMIQSNNVTSQGAIGQEALRRSNRKDRSRDPIYNQSKMYSEIFRTLGWIQSTKTKLTFSFTHLGLQVASFATPNYLLEECLLGISYPNEILSVKSNQSVRVISTILLVLNKLGSISRDEMILGPMSINDDKNIIDYNKMINLLNYCRKNPGQLNVELDKLSTKLGIKRKPTMENYTRFPMAAIPWAGWGIKKRGFIHLTPKGNRLADKIINSRDIRLGEFNNYPDSIKPAFIRYSYSQLLKRAQIDTTNLFVDVLSDESLVKSFLKTNDDIYFSPFQQLSYQTIKYWTPELIYGNSGKNYRKKRTINITTDKLGDGFTEVSLNYYTTVKNNKNVKSALEYNIEKMLISRDTVDDVINHLYLKYGNSNKEVFYPIIADMLNIIGFVCKVSRIGQNYNRADAIIFDEKHSIPIEIKSPCEEKEISIKAIRQALENKVIFLSRKPYPNDNDTTSLVIGYNIPNKRSEAYELISDIHKTYGVNISIIGFRSLLILVVNSIKMDNHLIFKNFNKSKGIISVRDFKPET